MLFLLANFLSIYLEILYESALCKLMFEDMICFSNIKTLWML